MVGYVLRAASPLGLYAEDFETETTSHLGNFPQAFSHLARSSRRPGRIILAGRLEELS
jgi:GH15 family glucan-1,4-alpha-glucosidase